MLVVSEKSSVLRHVGNLPWSFANVVTVEDEGTVDIHIRDVAVVTVPFNPIPGDRCVKLAVDCVAVPGIVERNTRREKDEPKRGIVRVVKLISVPLTLVFESSCAGFSVMVDECSGCHAGCRIMARCDLLCEMAKCDGDLGFCVESRVPTGCSADCSFACVQCSRCEG